jgi:hypothetical protein
MVLSSTCCVAALGCPTSASMTTVTLFHSLPTSPLNLTSQSRIQPPPRPPSCVLSRTIPTVLQLWREWTVGLGNTRVRRSIRASLASSPQRTGDVQPVESDHRRNSETEGINTGAAVEEVD